MYFEIIFLFLNQNICSGVLTRNFSRDVFLSTKTYVEIDGKENNHNLIYAESSFVYLEKGSRFYHFASLCVVPTIYGLKKDLILYPGFI